MAAILFVLKVEETSGQTMGGKARMGCDKVQLGSMNQQNHPDKVSGEIPGMPPLHCAFSAIDT